MARHDAVGDEYHMIEWLLVALVAALATAGFAVRSGRRRPMPGAIAPAFELPDQNGELRASGAFLGRWLVLYFYPRDDTPGCTEQAARFRDAMAEFESLGAGVCGVSVDASASHARFAAKYRLPFLLLSDRGGSVAASYGSLIELGVVRFARRNTFIVDPQGKVARVYVGVNPARNARDVADDLKRLVSA
jgi:peroxiredoxin Q/BCP